MSLLDFVVIGGGISGLYANYLLSKNENGILLEKDSIFGGRVIETNFHNTIIKLGAGIIEDNNYHSLKLLNKLKVKLFGFENNITSLLPDKFDMKKAAILIKQTYKLNKNNINNLTTIHFLKKYFDNNFVTNFIKNCAYHDFLESDIHYFIKYYDFYDIIPTKHTSYGLSWTDFVNKLVLPNCFTNKIVSKINRIGKLFQVITQNDKYMTKKIILALTLNPLNKLTKNLIDFNYNDYLGTIPFIRIFTWHSKPYDKSKIKHFNIVSNELYKIIPINDNVLMTAYTDNKDAIKLSKLINVSKNKQIIKVQQLLDELNLGINKIDDIIIHFWKEGVHYYKPHDSFTFPKLLKKLSKPEKNIIVLGEIVSKNHGNVEGSIESVERILKQKL